MWSGIERSGDGLLNYQYRSFCGGRFALGIGSKEKQTIRKIYCQRLDYHRIGQRIWASHLVPDAAKLYTRGDHRSIFAHYRTITYKTAAKFNLRLRYSVYGNEMDAIN